MVFILYYILISCFQMVPVLMLLMVALVAAESDTDSVSVVHCDASTYCPDGTTCCLNPYGSWGCCPYPMVSESQ